MTSGLSPLARTAASGWLALTADFPTLGADYPDLSDRLLDHLDLGRSVVFLSRGEEPPDEDLPLAEDLSILLGIECLRANVEAGGIGETRQAGLVLLHGGQALEWAETLEHWRPEETDEPVILAVGPAAAAMGSSIVAADAQELVPGAGWLPGAIVVTSAGDPATLSPVREALASSQRLYAIGLPQGAILALGPAGEVELWGRSQPIIALGRGWRQP